LKLSELMLLTSNHHCHFTHCRHHTGAHKINTTGRDAQNTTNAPDTIYYLKLSSHDNCLLAWLRHCRWVDRYLSGVTGCSMCNCLICEVGGRHTGGKWQGLQSCTHSKCSATPFNVTPSLFVSSHVKSL